MLIALIDDLDDLDWPEAIKEQQRNWIGRSVGAAINFPVSGDENTRLRYFLLVQIQYLVLQL